MDSEMEYHDFAPANEHCSNIKNETLTIPQPGTATTDNLNNIDKLHNQMIASSVHDNIDENMVKPLYGGSRNVDFNINFRNKNYKVNDNNEITAIKKILNNKVYKRDHLLEISYKNKSSIYVVRGFKKNILFKI